jgi:hypothetical protein
MTRAGEKLRASDIQLAESSGADPSGPVRALKKALANGRPVRDDVSIEHFLLCRDTVTPGHSDAASVLDDPLAANQNRPEQEADGPTIR